MPSTHRARASRTSGPSVAPNSEMFRKDRELLATSLEQRRLRPTRVQRPPEPLEDPDECCGAVELVTIDAVTGQRGKRVVGIVIRLAAGEHRETGEVRARITCVE